MALLDTPKLITVDKSTECHVTPEGIANRMVDYLELTGDEIVLEPEAGTGNLIAALLEQGHDHKNILAIERHYSLVEYSNKRFNNKVNIQQNCFLEFMAKNKRIVSFARILMNPPFKKIKQHMSAALSLLEKGSNDSAIMIALVPITYEHPDMEMLEELPAGTFPTAKVNTKIVKFEY